MITLRQMRLAALLASSATAVILAGCGGGASTNNNNLSPVTPSTPTIYGIEPVGQIAGGELFETSGFGTADLSTGYVTGAVASTAQPPSSIRTNGTIPLGFAPGSQYIDLSYGTAVLTGAPVIFRSYISNGNDAGGKLLAIVPSSVKLTSPELPAFSQPMTFTSVFNGPLANGQYTTSTFTLPFSTVGLHTVVSSVSDITPQTTTTTFKVAVVSPATACVVAQIVDADGSPVVGATASITGEVAGASQQATSDALGVVVLFATPVAGGNKITVTKGALTGTDTQTLTGGGTLSHVIDGTDDLPYSVTLG